MLMPGDLCPFVDTGCLSVFLQGKGGRYTSVQKALSGQKEFEIAAFTFMQSEALSASFFGPSPQ